MYNGRSPGARRAAPKKGPSLLPYQDRRLGSEIINLSHTAVRIASIPDLIRLKHRETLPDDWGAGWEAHRVHQLTFALRATPAQRLAWLEEMIVLAYQVGALAKSRDRPVEEGRSGCRTRTLTWSGAGRRSRDRVRRQRRRLSPRMTPTVIAVALSLHQMQQIAPPIDPRPGISDSSYR